MLKNFLGVVKLLIVIDIHVLIDIQISFLKINHSCLILKMVQWHHLKSDTIL